MCFSVSSFKLHVPQPADGSRCVRIRSWEPEGLSNFHLPVTVWITALALQAQILEYFCICIRNIKSLLQFCFVFTFCIMDRFEYIQKQAKQYSEQL